MSVDVQTMLEEARTLVAAHEYARAKSSLLVASYLHPADAAISFEHWRVCCLANERNPATRILTSVCASSEHLESFCALLVEELRGVAQGGGENSFVREGWLASDMDSCKQILTCCLIKLSKRKDTLTAEERRSVLFHLASMSKDHALVWWAASELAFEADAQAGADIQRSTEWSGMLANKCLPILLRGGGMAMGEEELARVKPLVERAALHHFCAAQTEELRQLGRSFLASCPKKGIHAKALSDANGPASLSPAACHSLALAFAHAISSTSEEGSAEKPLPAVAYLAVLCSFLADLARYAQACASNTAAEERVLGMDGEEEEEEEGHGWFVVQLQGGKEKEKEKDEDEEDEHDDSDSEDEERERGGAVAGQKRARWAMEAAASGAGGEEVSGAERRRGRLGRRLAALSSLWDALQSKDMQAEAAHHVRKGAVWAEGHWTWRSGMANLFWYRGEMERAVTLLQTVASDLEAPVLERTRGRLQLILCGRLKEEEGRRAASKRRGKATPGAPPAAQELRQIAREALAQASIGWAHALPQGGSWAAKQEGHVPLTWAEVLLQALAALLEVEAGGGGRRRGEGAAQALVISQVAWPRLGRFCVGALGEAGFDVHALVRSARLQLVHNVDILEMLFARAAAATKKAAEDEDDEEMKVCKATRALLEKRMGSLGVDPACPVTEILEAVLKAQ